MQLSNLKTTLEQHPKRNKLIQHPLFTRPETFPVTGEQAAILVGQWWHPLHFFPTFLAGLIASARSNEVRTATSRILFQELGEGTPARAHEALYQSTMIEAGFRPEQIVAAEPFAATRALVTGYDNASRTELEGIGYLYATEVADLTMVSSIGTAVRRATGIVALPWVDIHVEQEPAHVHEAREATSLPFNEEQVAQIVATAAEAWTRWIGFFDEVTAAMDSIAHPASPPARERAGPAVGAS